MFGNEYVDLIAILNFFDEVDSNYDFIEDMEKYENKLDFMCDCLESIILDSEERNAKNK